MKRGIFVLLAIVICVSFVLVGCDDGKDNPLIGTWNMYDSNKEKTEVTFTKNQVTMFGTVKKYEISEDGTEVIIKDSDGTERSAQFLVVGDVLTMEGDTLYRSGSAAEKEFLDS